MPRVEQPVTPEKSRDELCFDTLKAKRNVLSSHYALGQLRKGRKVEEMSEAEIEDYKSVKGEYDKRRELFLASFNNLNEDDSQKVAELTSLTKVEIVLSSFETPVRQTDEDMAGETRIHPEEPQEEKSAKSDQTKELERLLAEKYRILHQEVSVIDRRPLEEEIRALEAEKNRSETELLERQEAEANPDRPAPKGFMQRVRDSYNKAKEAVADYFVGTNAISGGRETVEARMSPLGLRKEAIESLSPDKPIEPTQPQPEKEPKKPSGWGWIKERGKGYLTFGLWELHQAERFRSKTKEVANDTEALATLIQQERNLNLEEAEKEAWEIVEELKKNNLAISAPEFYQANKDITERKRKENDEEIEYIIKSAGEDLHAKLGIGKGAFKEYRGWAGKDILTKEDELAFEADLRGELSKMRDGAMRKDFINFAKLMRKNLDQGWWNRYVWAFNEALAGFMGVSWLTMKWEAIQAAKLAMAEKAVTGGTEAGIAAAQESLTGYLQQSIWQDLANSGVPTEQLPDLTREVLNSNNLSDRILEGVRGGLDAWRLPQNFVIDYGSISQKLVELGADLTKLGIR